MVKDVRPDVKSDSGPLDDRMKLPAGKRHVIQLVPLLVRARWSKHEALDDEEVDLIVDLHRRVDGDLALSIYRHPPDQGGAPLAQLTAPISSTTVRYRWTIDLPDPEGRVDIAEGNKLHVADLYFVAARDAEQVSSGTEEAELLHVREQLELTVADEDTDKLVPNSPYLLVLSDGDVRYGMLDGQSRVVQNDVPRGPVEIVALYQGDDDVVL